MRESVEAYFKAFNAGDGAGMLALVSDDIEHHVNQGEIRRGRAAFEAFLAHMDQCYKEHLSDIVIFEGDQPGRFAAEFTVNGTYLATDEGLPEAKGQRYVLPAGSFFTLEAGKITRVTTYYNLQDWIDQVSA